MVDGKNTLIPGAVDLVLTGPRRGMPPDINDNYLNELSAE